MVFAIHRNLVPSFISELSPRWKCAIIGGVVLAVFRQVVIPLLNFWIYKNEIEQKALSTLKGKILKLEGFQEIKICRKELKDNGEIRISLNQTIFEKIFNQWGTLQIETMGLNKETPITKAEYRICFGITQSLDPNNIRQILFPNKTQIITEIENQLPKITDIEFLGKGNTYPSLFRLDSGSWRLGITEENSIYIKQINPSISSEEGDLEFHIKDKDDIKDCAKLIRLLGIADLSERGT